MAYDHRCPFGLAVIRISGKPNRFGKTIADGHIPGLAIEVSRLALFNSYSIFTIY